MYFFAGFLSRSHYSIGSSAPLDASQKTFIYSCICGEFLARVGGWYFYGSFKKVFMLCQRSARESISLTLQSKKKYWAWESFVRIVFPLFFPPKMSQSGRFM